LTDSTGTNTDWLQFSLTVTADRVEAAERALFDAGAVSVTLGEGGDDEVFEPAPGETPLWQQVRVTGLFPSAASIEDVRQHLDLALGESPWQPERLADRPWEREWLKHFKPQRFAGKLLVWPGDEPPRANASDTVLRLDPGLAFGTGTHPTTALCLDWLASQPQLPGDVIDYGCGSGILAVAALLLGAGRALAVDIDPQALAACRDNAERNGIDPARLEVRLPDSFPPTAPAGLVLANILAEPLIALAPRLYGCLAPGGQLVLSGLLAAQAGPVVESYLGLPGADIVLAESREQDGWLRLVLKRLE